MVLIPNDIGIRMRLQNEAQLLQPVAPITELAGDFPDLRTGQQFTARITEALPQGTFKALVGGKDVTLSLPEGVKTGDTLELVVVDRSAKSIIAQLAPTGPDAGVATSGKPYPFTQLSPAAQLIGALLPDDGQPAPAAALNRGQPLLAAAPTSGAPLAVALQQAVKNSGVFYEAHQAQWVTGRYPLAQLLDEPQAQHSDFNRLVGHFLQAEGEAAGNSPVSNLLSSGTRDGTSSLLEPNADSATESSKSALAGRRSADLADGRSSLGSATDGTSSKPVSVRGTAESLAGPASGPPSNQRMPEEIRPIVQQQLDALATDRLVWHGEAWPQQVLEWQIEREARRPDTDEEGPRWNTRLALTTPALGTVDARLQVSRNGVRIVVHAQSTDTAERLRAALPELRQSLEAAGVPLLGFAARDPSPPDSTAPTSAPEPN